MDQEFNVLKPKIHDMWFPPPICTATNKVKLSLQQMGQSHPLFSFLKNMSFIFSFVIRSFIFFFVIRSNLLYNNQVNSRSFLFFSCGIGRIKVIPLIFMYIQVKSRSFSLLYCNQVKSRSFLFFSKSKSFSIFSFSIMPDQGHSLSFLVPIA